MELILLAIILLPFYIIYLGIKFVFCVINTIVTSINKTSKNNSLAFYCDNCNELYNFNNSCTCKKCGSYMKILSKNAGRKRKKEFKKYKEIMLKSKKNISNNENFVKCSKCGSIINDNDIFCTSCGIKRKNNKNESMTCNSVNYTKTYNYSAHKDTDIDEFLRHFYDCLHIANQPKTKEILEVLIEFGELDKSYLEIHKIKPNFLNRIEYEETKLNILDNIISDKFRKYLGGKDSKKKKIEKMKSFLDELYVCKRRYPEYKEILDKHIKIINNYVNYN